MKRSEINEAIQDMEKLLKELCFALPGFCSWTAEDWQEKGREYNEIRDNMLGWDVTDYGQADFKKQGLVLVTTRNGNVNNPEYKKTYSEKVLMIYEGQTAPMHFHWKKMEDIINRGGGNLIFRLFNGDQEGKKLDTDVEIYKDGCTYSVKPGSDVLLAPGESLTLYPYCYHEFIAAPGSGRVLVGEVSRVNDDNNDNKFFEPLGRFPEIEEDVKIYRLLCNEYPVAD